jgi:hypothetical protein
VLVDSDQEDPPRLQIFDTKQATITEPTRTSFFFPTAYMNAPTLSLSSEPCGHIPSPDELMTAPFYSDPSQRILSLYFGQYDACFAVNAELLLGLAREREGQDVGWEEWGAHTIEIGGLNRLAHIWVSGCRLFCILSDDVYGEDLLRLQIYDFSHAGRAKHLRTLDSVSEGGGTRWISPSLHGYGLPWGVLDLWDVTVGHDSIFFCVVSILIPTPTSSRLNGGSKPVVPSRGVYWRAYSAMGLALQKRDCTRGVFKCDVKRTVVIEIGGVDRGPRI